MKRIGAVLLSALLLLTTFPTFAVSAEVTEPSIVVGVPEEGVHAGDTFTVTVNTVNNPGIVSVALKVGYDADVLELVSIKGQDFAGTSFGPLTANPIAVNWYDALSPNNTTDGVLAELTFTVKEDAAAGDTAITLTYNPDNIYDFDFNNVTFAMVEGVVSIHRHDAVCEHVYDNACDAECNECGERRGVSDHLYDNACDTTCNECGAEREITHIYDNACDADCNVCGATREVGDHVYTNACDRTCDECGATRTPESHVYDNACDPDCNVCGTVRTPWHSYTNACDPDCNACGAVREVGPHYYTNACDISCNVCGAIREITRHYYTDDCDISCNVCGLIRTPPHLYDNACDAECNLCGETREVGDHVYDDDLDADCNECGYVRETDPIVTEITAPAAVTEGFYRWTPGKKNFYFGGIDEATAYTFSFDYFLPEEVSSLTFSSVSGNTSTVAGSSKMSILPGHHTFSWTVWSSVNQGEFKGQVVPVIKIPAGATMYIWNWSVTSGGVDVEPVNRNYNADQFEDMTYGVAGGPLTTYEWYPNMDNMQADPTNPFVTKVDIAAGNTWYIGQYRDSAGTQDEYIFELSFEYYMPDEYRLNFKNGPGFMSVLEGSADLIGGHHTMTVKTKVAKYTETIDPETGEVIKTGAYGNAFVPLYVNSGADATLYVWNMKVTLNGKEIELKSVDLDEASREKAATTDASKKLKQYEWAIPEEDGVAPMDKYVHNHVYDNDCDAFCNDCGAEREVPDHIYDNACDTACNECGEMREITHTYDNNCDSDCNECGMTRIPADHVYTNACDVDCNVCGEARAPADHVYTNTCDIDCNVCGDTREVGDHVYEHACDTTCNECGAVREITHVYDNACDADCNVCGATRTPADHKGGVATCRDKAVCAVCGAEYGGLDPDNHVGGEVTTGQRPATCAAEGYTGDIHCGGCDALLVKGEAIAKLPHEWTNACDADCNACGETRTPADHVYDNACDATCNVCGDTRTTADHVYGDLRDLDCNECGGARKINTFKFTAPATRVYTKGATLDLTGGWIDIAYADGASGRLELTADMVRGFDPDNTTAVQTVTVSFGGKTATYKVRVMEGDELPTFVVDSLDAYKTNGTFDVTIRLENNPGIVSMVLDVNYDTDALELVSIKGQDFAGTSFGPLSKTPIAVNWCDAINPNNTTDGVVAVLTFRIKDDAPEGPVAITVSYDQANVYDYDFEDVPFNVTDGVVSIFDYMRGDLNGDCIVDNKDLGLMMQYLNRWNVEIDVRALDVYADGVIDNKDYGLLQRYLNRWDVELG